MIILSAALALTAVAVVYGQNAFAATVFSDDFEDGDTSGWSKSGGTLTVVTDGSGAAPGQRCSENAREFAGNTSWTTTQSGPGQAADPRVQRPRRAARPLHQLHHLLPPGPAARQPGPSCRPSTAARHRARSAAGPSSTGTWYTLCIDTSGSTIRGSVDGTQSLRPAARSPAPAGSACRPPTPPRRSTTSPSSTGGTRRPPHPGPPHGHPADRPRRPRTGRRPPHRRRRRLADEDR